MDTRFWGPPGWRMLHLISFAVDQPYGPRRADVVRFFALLPYVLPCKYCRANLSEHIQQEPLTPANLGKWLWTIHNMANAKLRTQKIPTAADPPFEAVKKVYLERLGFGCTRTLFEGWEFLFSIAEAHPMSLGKPEPITGAPKGLEAADSLERNRWNVMAPEERLPFITEFLDLLPAVLPFPEWRAAAANSCGGESDWSTRALAIKSLWGMRCSMESKLELLNKTSYSSLCKELRLNRSGCGASRRRKTCRRRRQAAARLTKMDSPRKAEQMAPETRKENIFDVFQPGLRHGAARLPYSPHKRYFYVEHPEKGWRVYLRSACMIHELYKPFDARRFIVVKRTGADPAKASWEAPKGQMEAKDGLGKDRKGVLQLLKENIRREVEEEAKISRLRELAHTGLVLQSVEPDFPPNTFFQYHIFSAYAHPAQLEKAFAEFEWIAQNPEEFAKKRSDQREKDAIRWYGGEETKLMGRWSPTITKLYLKTYAAP